MPEERQEKKRRGIPSPFTAVRMVRLGMTVARTVGTVGAALANPAIWAVIVPVGLVLLALFVILFRTGFTGAPGVTPILQPTFPPGVASDCPVPGGRISTRSYQEDKTNGHCSPTYEFDCTLCGYEGMKFEDRNTSRRAKAIDVETKGQNVVLPTIKGQIVQWKLLVGPYQVKTKEGGGLGYTFETEIGGDKWHIDMLHLGETSLTKGRVYPSGTPVAKSVINHVHVTIGENIKVPENPGFAITDCDPGWQATDFICR